MSLSARIKAIKLDSKNSVLVQGRYSYPQLAEGEMLNLLASYAAEGDLKNLKYFFDLNGIATSRKVNINETLSDGSTILGRALDKNHTSVVEYLSRYVSDDHIRRLVVDRLNDTNRTESWQYLARVLETRANARSSQTPQTLYAEKSKLLPVAPLHVQSHQRRHTIG